jgi:hypothetical protein
MKPIPDGIRKILAATIVREHPDDYSIVYIDLADEEKAMAAMKDLKPFSSVTYTEDEISMVLRVSDWSKLKKGFPSHKEEGPYKLITFDIVLDLSIIGFLSVVSTALAENEIAIYALSTYLKDHILVKKADAPKAIRVLRELVEDAKR